MTSNAKKFDESVGNFSETLLPLLTEFKPKQVQYIEQAFDFAKKAHGQQKRISGESYFAHPLSVAIDILEHQPDKETVAAALLHDVVEDCDVSINELSDIFGLEVGQLVDGVTKISSIEMKEKALGLEFSKNHFTSQIDSYRKLLTAMAGDPRVLIIKLYDRLHNSQTLEWLPKHRQKFYAQETIEIYAILAERVGMGKIKSELEDNCFFYAYPDEYNRFINIISKEKKLSSEFVEKKISEIKNSIDTKYIIDVYGRIKHNLSAYKKLEEKNFDFSKIYDLVAIRIITQEIKNCYRILGEINHLFQPIVEQNYDFISRPKDNGYQSLHATVADSGGHIFEVQIRTPEMHQIAEFGIAAHWRYKENRYGRSNNKESLSWADEVSSSGIKNYFSNKIFVFSPQGKIIELPKNATPLDFAFFIHTQIGLSCFGAKVNSKIVPISSRLKTGDVVEIIKNERVKPSRDWLGFVKTNFARNKIREYFTDLERPKNYAIGLDVVNSKLAKLERPIITEKNTKSLSAKISDSRLPFNDLETALVSVGKKDISKNDVIKIIYPDVNFADTNIIKRALGKKTVHFEIGDGFTNRLANCCKPTEKDKIIGYITLQKIITIHKSNCRGTKTFDKERILKAFWR